jgi:hypothetical protein
MHVEQNVLLVGGERDAQLYGLRVAAGLPNIGLDGLRVGLLVSAPKVPRHALEPEREEALLRLVRDRLAANLANWERRAVEGLAVEADFQKQGVTARASTEPMPDDLVPSGRRHLSGQGDGDQDQYERCKWESPVMKHITTELEGRAVCPGERERREPEPIGPRRSED